MNVLVILKSSHIDELILNLIYTNLKTIDNEIAISALYSSSSKQNSIFDINHLYKNSSSITNYKSSWKILRNNSFDLCILVDSTLKNRLLLNLSKAHKKIRLTSKPKSQLISTRSKIYLEKKITQVELMLKKVIPNHKMIKTPFIHLNKQVLSNTLNIINWNETNKNNQNAVLLIDKKKSNVDFKFLMFLLNRLQETTGIEFILILENTSLKNTTKIQTYIKQRELHHMDGQYLFTKDPNQISALIFKSKFLITNSIQWIYLSSLLEKKIPNIDIHINESNWKNNLFTSEKRTKLFERKLEEIVYFIEHI